MTVTPCDKPTFDIDRSQLAVIKKRFIAFNQQRFQRTLNSLDSRQQLFLELLPLLFHVNHPSMPGYVSDSQCSGIIHYKPDKAVLKKAKQLSKSFRYQSLQKRTQAIRSIFVMGSIGTVGQSRSSDLDFWVCHDPKLSTELLQQLQKRCTALEEWASTLGLEACFFLMDSDSFREGNSTTISKESSGSTQHKLLLDEFYRTAIHLAGQWPLWWFVPAEFESQYTDYAHQMMTNRFLRANEVIDLGGMDKIPPQEFITAGVWQLYKAISAPYKSLLKLLLLEVYTRRECDLELLSLKLKQSIYNNALSIDALDPYLLMFNSLIEHLTNHNQTERIELVRHCFYFKVNKPLSKSPKTSPASWQRHLLSDMVTQWAWDDEKIRQIDERHQWKAPQVIHEKMRLISELLNSYRLLSESSQRQDVSHGSLLQNDIAILGRKLYAAFERKSGKIELINPNISSDLSEEYLTFFRAQSAQGATQWEVFSQRKTDPLEPRYRLHSRVSLVELLVWCFSNQIWTERTQASIQTNNHSMNARGLFQTLSQWKGIETATFAEERAFKTKAEPNHTLILINVNKVVNEYSKTSSHPDKPALEDTNHTGLINDIHLVSRNSWGETTVSSYADNPLEEFIKGLVLLFQNTANMSGNRFQFFSPPMEHASSLKLRIEHIVKQIDRSLTQLPKHTTGKFIIDSGHSLVCVEKKNQQVSSSSFWSSKELIHTLSKPSSHFCHLSADPLSLSGTPLSAVFRQSLTKAIQVFYCAEKSHQDAEEGTHKTGTLNSDDDTDKLATLFIFDEQNTLTSYQVPFRNEQSLLQPLHRFLRSVITRLQLTCDDSDFGIYPIEFYHVQKNTNNHYQAIRCHITTELQNLQFFNIQAIAEPHQGDDLPFSMFCGHEAFYQSQYGDTLYSKVAHHVLSRRRHAERYPCYLTDLDLGSQPQTFIGNAPLQTAHFLMVKNSLEKKLNSALQAL